MKSGSALWHLLAPLVIASTVFGSGCGSRSAEESMQAAKGSLAQGDLPAAIIELKNALQVGPDRAEARLLLGMALHKSNNPTQAAVELRKAYELGAPADEVVPALAHALLESGEFDKTVELGRTSTLTAPQAVASLKTTAATALSALGRDDEADKLNQLALSAKPDHVPALLFRARALAGGRDFVAASKIVDDVLARTPADADALTIRGDLLQAAGNDIPGAVNAYRRALIAKPDWVPAHVALMTLLLGQQDLARTQAQLDELRKLRPDDLQTKYFEARIAAYTGDMKTAQNLTQQLLVRAPSSPRVLQLAAAVAFSRGQFLQAESHLKTVLQRLPGSHAARQMLARTQLAAGKPFDALDTLQPLLKAPSPDLQTLLLAGGAHMVQGESRPAAAFFNRAEKLNPTDPTSRTALAVARMMSGDPSGSLQQLGEIASTDTGTTADLALIAGHASQRRFDAALNAIAKLEVKQPGKPLAHQLRARVLLAKGDIAGARSSFEKALAVEPGYLASVEGLAALDLRDSKPERARARYESALKAHPRDERILGSLAALDERSGKPKQEVAASLEQAVLADPENAGLRRRLIFFHMAKQDHKLALNAAQAALSARPGDLDMLELLAAAQLRAGEVDQAVRSYTTLVSGRPGSPDMLVGLAEARFAANSFDGAADTAARALALAPDSVLAMQTAIKIDVAARNHDAALAKARALQRRKPESAQGWIFEGDIEFARSAPSVAAAAYRVALAKQDSTVIAQRLHGALRSSTDAAGADSFSDDWLKKHPTDTSFLNYLASWAIADRKFELATDYLERLLQVSPGNAAALNNLAWTQASLKRPSAVATAEQANKLSPNQPMYLDTLAFALAAEAKLERAIQVQRQAVALDPQAHSLRLSLARYLLQAGNKAGARDELAILARLGDSFAQQRLVSELQAKL